MGLPGAAALVANNQSVTSLMRSAVAATADVADDHARKITGSDVVLILLTFSVIIRVFNYHCTQLPNSVAIALGSIFFTGCLVVASLVPYSGAGSVVEFFMKFLHDFPEIVLHYMLGFLLFAAALEVKQQMLERIWSTVLALSIFSTMISTVIVSVLTYLLMQSVNEMMEFKYCLLFGAIVSPTDPVTVISIVNEKTDLLPKSTEYFVLGESLLNDAIGVVLYLVFIELVQKPNLASIQILSLILQKVLVECIGGALIGIVLAWVAYSAIKSIQDPLLEVMITFVLVGNINMFCNFFHASIPLASVFAGLFVGNYGVEFAMSPSRVDIFREIWKLVDETLNSVLFLMIGAAELFWNPNALGLYRVVVITVSIICISIFARAVSVALPLFGIILLEWATGRRLRHPAVKYRGGTLAVLTWAGMRGGISIALALGIPDAFVQHAVEGHMTNGQLIFFMTFALVVFSIIIQGLFFEPVVRAITRVSYRIMPSIGTSGGLGTFVSTMDLHQDTEPREPIESPDGLTDLQGTLVEDVFGTFTDDGAVIGNRERGEVIGMNSVLRHTENGLPQYNDDMEMNRGALARTRSQNYGGYRSSPMPAHVLRFRSRTERSQGSATFANLGRLQEPPTVNEIVAQGSRALSSMFVTRATTQAGNYALRRSRTTPDTSSLARGAEEGQVSQDDLAASLGKALRNHR